MIRSEDLHNELVMLKTASDKLANDGKIFESCVIQAFSILIKLVLNIRQNQVNRMRQDGIKFTVPKKKYQLDSNTNEYGEK